MQQITCKKCGNLIDVPDPHVELVNQISVSMIVWAHGEPIACTCGNAVIGMIPEIPIAHIKLTFVDVPQNGLPSNVKPKQQANRIINPFGR